MQVLVPVQPSPDHPVKSELTVGVAVSVTDRAVVEVVEHVAPQVIPTGLELTEPDPVPVLETVRVLSGFRSNVAVTECAASIVTMQVPVPVQPDPVQPVKSEPTSAVAVSVTTAPSPKALEHVAPQSIPAGLEVTEPVPVPVFDTSKMCVPMPNVASPSARRPSSRCRCRCRCTRSPTTH